ncbi:hypothetical protein GGS24DRAFT_498173 [Hypoxylon argillaceum]|nr:hypothetical protein GGS24DRAFT_498173 [Hypoxylon argillaceum]
MTRLWYNTFRDFFSHRRLWLFPLLAGTFWFTTLTTLLVRWLCIGRPRYPDQTDSDIPFVSDIAAQTFQPVFIAGCVATGACFFGTVFAVHHVRYSPKFYGLTDDTGWRQGVSLVALVAGLVASVSLVLLGIFNTHDTPDKHQYMLMVTFGGLFISGLATTVVWLDQAHGNVMSNGLRKWYILNTFLVLCQFVLGVFFLASIFSSHLHAAGVLEWCLTYMGSFWLLSFVGYTRFEEPVPGDQRERQPLLV